MKDFESVKAASDHGYICFAVGLFGGTIIANLPTFWQAIAVVPAIFASTFVINRPMRRWLKDQKW